MPACAAAVAQLQTDAAVNRRQRLPEHRPESLLLPCLLCWLGSPDRTCKGIDCRDVTEELKAGGSLNASDQPSTQFTNSELGTQASQP